MQSPISTQYNTLTVQMAAETAAAKRRREWFSHAALHAVLIVLSIVALLPFVWMVATSLKGAKEVLSATPTFLPRWPMGRCWWPGLAQPIWIRWAAPSDLLVQTTFWAS